MLLPLLPLLLPLDFLAVDFVGLLAAALVGDFGAGEPVLETVGFLAKFNLIVGLGFLGGLGGEEGVVGMGMEVGGGASGIGVSVSGS